jgi:hypothetical protein
MSKYQAWAYDDESGFSIDFGDVDGVEDRRNRGLINKNAKLLHEVDGEDWEEAMIAHYKIMGWGEYKPL